MALVGIHKGINGDFPDFLQRYESILDYNGIQHIRMEADDHDFWQRIKDVDLFIFRWNTKDTSKQVAQTIIPMAERVMEVSCFPNVATCWHYDDKIRQHYVLNYRGFPVIDSWIFWNRKKALEWIETATFPLIFKLKAGSASHNVLLVENKDKARRLIRLMFGKGFISGKIAGFGSARSKDFNLMKEIRRRGGRMLRRFRGEDVGDNWQVNKNYILFQKFLPGNEYDTRVVVIGKRAYAFRRFNRKGDFRASGSDTKDLDPNAIDREFLRIAFKISETFEFQCMAYDFLYDENKQPRVVEMSYTFPDKTIPNCPGYWDDQLNWHEGHYWAQYFQLMDALNRPDLKQPDMKRETLKK